MELKWKSKEGEGMKKTVRNVLAILIVLVLCQTSITSEAVGTVFVDMATVSGNDAEMPDVISENNIEIPSTVSGNDASEQELLPVSLFAEKTLYEKALSHESIPIYAEGNIAYDVETTSDLQYCTVVPYLSENPNGAAVVVFPGGGYSGLSAYTEGSVGEAQGIYTECYNEAGISVFVVYYRTTKISGEVNYKQILSDGTRAIRFIRANAEEFGIEEDKIGVLGYSAGGHLATMMCTHWDWEIADSNYVPDEVDAVSARPDFGILSYPVASLFLEQDGMFTAPHYGTYKSFSSENGTINEDIALKYSGENSVKTLDNFTQQTPPIFIHANIYDSTVLSVATLRMAEALEEAGIDYELHLFHTGDKQHAYSVGGNYANTKTWPELSVEFLESLDIVSD